MTTGRRPRSPARGPGPAATTRSRSGLTRDGVARAALELLDRDGLDALSMRRLADELGAGTMTIYGYFRNKEELLEAVIDVGFADFEPPAPSDDPLAALRELMLEARAVLRRHPALVEIRGSGPIVRPRAYRLTEAALSLLKEAGFEPDDATRVYRTLFEYVFGHGFVNRRPVSPELRREALASIVVLSPEEFPALTEAAEAMADVVADERQFDHGLDVIFEGIRARLRR